MTDTIFALSSGAPPAAIAVIRISGPDARTALSLLAGSGSPPRKATLRTLRSTLGETLDTALVLWLPGPGTATGEDMAELHCHGGRAVVAAVEAALGSLSGLRRADPGEFTRRAFANGRIDLAEAEGLADLLSAETEMQRRNAVSLAGGALSRQAGLWREALLAVSAIVEAELDFGDEDDVASAAMPWRERLDALSEDLRSWLARPAAELLRDGLRVVLAGPPNAGKSTLFNALVGADAAIITPVPGTTRDLLSRPVALAGMPFVFVDTAGLRIGTQDVVEEIGIARARAAAADADIVLWLGEEGLGPERSWEVEARIDEAGHTGKARARHRVSALTGDGMGELVDDLVRTSRGLLPRPGELALNRRQRQHLGDASEALAAAADNSDPLLVAESLRRARTEMDQLLGRTAVEDMLDALFGRFCLGK